MTKEGKERQGTDMMVHENGGAWCNGIMVMVSDAM